MRVKGIRFKSGKKGEKSRKINFRFSLKYIRCFFEGAAVTVILTAAVAFFGLKNGESDILYYGLYLCIASGAFVTGFNGFSVFGGKGILTGLLCGIPHAILITAFIIFEIKTGISPFILYIIPVSVIFAATGGIVNANTKVRK